MRLDHPGRFAMLRRSLLELPSHRPLDVACAGGALWLTLDHDERDIVLERGQSVRIGPDRRALVYALDDAVLELSEVHEVGEVRQAPPPRAAQALGLALA